MLNLQVTPVGFRTAVTVNDVELRFSIVHNPTDNTYGAAWKSNDRALTPKWQALRVVADDLIEIERFILERLSGKVVPPWRYVTGEGTAFRPAVADAASVFKLEE